MPDKKFNTLSLLDRQTLPFGIGTWSLGGPIKYGKMNLGRGNINKNESVTKAMNAYGDLYGIHQD